MKTIWQEKDLNKVFGYVEAADCMALEELEELTEAIWSYKNYCVGFGFTKYINGEPFQMVRVWEKCGDQYDGEWLDLKFTTDGLVSTDPAITRLVIKWAQQNIDKIA